MPAEQNHLLIEQASLIRASQVLGRSRLINSLFDFLVDCSLAGRAPKEIDIAIDAFGRGPTFDPSQDAVVRVCIFKLKKKLDEFYDGPGNGEPVRIVMARGEYRLFVASLAPPEESPPVPAPNSPSDDAPVVAAVDKPAKRRRLSMSWVAAFLGLSLLANALLWSVNPVANDSGDGVLRDVRSSRIWRPLLDDDLPIFVIVGDYYIFGEVDGSRSVLRLVRDFGINSAYDLERSNKLDSAQAERYQDLDLAYVPTAIAYALRDIMPVLAGVSPRVRVILSSDMNAEMFKAGHIIYVGFFSGLGMLEEPVFAGSRFSRGESYDELVDKNTGDQYVSEVGGPVQGKLKYRDYGYVATFKGPAGNQLLIIAGTRDTAVMQTAEMVVDPSRIRELEAIVGGNSGEALYEVYGFEKTNMDARLVLAAPLDVAPIWTRK